MNVCFISTKLPQIHWNGSTWEHNYTKSCVAMPWVPLSLCLSPPLYPINLELFSWYKERLRKMQKHWHPAFVWSHMRFVSANWRVSAPRSGSCGRVSEIKIAFSFNRAKFSHEIIGWNPAARAVRKLLSPRTRRSFAKCTEEWRHRGVCRP